MAYVIAVLLGLSIGLLGHVSEAKGKRVVDSVEVSSQVSEKGKDWVSSLRTSVSHELELVDWSSVPTKEHVVLMTSLEHFKTFSNGRLLRIECIVTIAIRGVKSGNIRAILRGRANADTSSESAGQTQHEVLEAAVRGAVHGLPTAILQSS